MLGGYEWARIEHFTLTILFTLFFLVHIIQVCIAGWNNFRSMVTGFEVVSTHQLPFHNQMSCFFEFEVASAWPAQ